MQGLDADRSAGGPSTSAAGRVLYVGTFSKTLCPALRLGYLIVPPLLVDTFAGAKGAAVGHTASMEQAVLTEFIDDGHFTRHIRRMRQVYAERQAAMVAAASAHLARWVEVRPSPAGMYLVGWLRHDIQRKGFADATLSRIALEHAIVTTPLSAYRLRAPGSDARSVRGALLFGYAAFREAALWNAAQQLEKVFTSKVRA
jgi:GntR family transcriptional regulator/MocR family aminotransferase